MPNEYAAASAKPRPRETPPESLAPALPPAPASAGVCGLPAWPTMIDETIGSIGSTHGVSESRRPAMKNAPTIGQNEPPRSTASMPDESAAAACEPALDVVAARPGPDGPPGSSTTRAVPVAAEAGEADGSGALHGRVAQAGVGAALARHDKTELGARLLDGNQDRDRVAVRLDVLLEGLVVLDLALRDRRRAERRAVRCELELLTVQVVAGSDRERHLDRLRVVRTSREAERLLGRQEVVCSVSRLERAAGDPCKREQQQRDAPSSDGPGGAAPERKVVPA